MKFRHELSYAASPDEVFEMLADRAFREKVCTTQGVVSSEVTLEHRGEGFTLRNDQVQRTQGLPPFARKFAGETTPAIQIEDWPDRRGGSLRIEAPGKPTAIDGTISLLPDGEGTTEVVELEIKAKVPLVGGKLEGLVAEQVRNAMNVEHGVGTDWLDGAR